MINFIETFIAILAGLAAVLWTWLLVRMVKETRDEKSEI